MERQCERCTYYDQTTSECRRHAPTKNGHWPEVRPDDWCGRYEPGDKAARESIEYRN